MQTQEAVIQQPKNTKTNGQSITDRIKAATPKQGILEKVKITPEVAEEILKLNTRNRPVHDAALKDIIDELNNDKWEFNGDPLTFDTNFVLVNGQKRCLAVIQTGKSIVANIQAGLSPKAYAVTDVGQRRDGSDVLAMEGYKDRYVMAAAMRGIIHFRNMRMVSAKISRKRVTNRQIEEWVGSRDIRVMADCVHYAITVLHPASKVLSQSNWAFLYFLLRKVDAKDAHFFITKLATADNISKESKRTNPIYYAHQRLRNIKEEVYNAKELMDMKVRTVLTAWNIFREHKIVEGGKLEIDKKEIKLPTPK